MVTVMLKKLLAAIAFIATIFGLLQRNRADRNEAEAKHQSQRADSAESESATHQRVNDAREAVQQKQKKEQVDAQQRMDDGRRDHLDNNG